MLGRKGGEEEECEFQEKKTRDKIDGEREMKIQ